MQFMMETSGGKQITVERQPTGIVYLTIAGEDEFGEQVEMHARLLTDSKFGNEVTAVRDMLDIVR